MIFQYSSYLSSLVLFVVMSGQIFIILVLFFVINLFLKDVVLQVFILFFLILIPFLLFPLPFPFDFIDRCFFDFCEFLENGRNCA